MKTERELFEEAFKKVNSGVSFWLNTWSDEDNDYGHLTASWGWHMWQASANREGYKLVPIDNGSSITRFSTQGLYICSVSNTKP